MKIDYKNAAENLKLTGLGLLFNIFPAILISIITIFLALVFVCIKLAGGFEPREKPDYSYVNLQKCEVTQKYDNRDNEFVVRCKFD